MKNLGNFYAGQTIRGSFNSRSTSGAPITLAGTPALAVYKDGNTTQVTTGVTLTVDFDSVTGHHLYEIVTTDAFYTKASDFRVVLTAGTVDSVSVVGVEVGSFSIENRSDELILRNAFVSTRLAIGTVTSQTELILTGGPTNNIGNVMAIIYDNDDAAARVVAEGSYVGSTGTLTLTATTGITVTTSDTVTLVAVSAASTDVNVTQWGGTAVASANVLIDGAITAAKIAADAITDAKVAADVTIASVTGSVGSVLGGINTAAGTITTLDALDTAQDTQHGTTRTAIPATSAIADAIWDEALSGHSTAGTAGLALATASSGGVDPSVLADAIWDEALSGHATAGTAGKALTDVLGDTAELQADWANGGRLDLLIDALPTAAAIADAVWDEATSGHATAGTYGASVLIIGVGYTHTRSASTSNSDTATITRS